MVNYGKLTVCELENHDMSRENPLFLWPCPTAFSMFTRPGKKPMVSVIDLPRPSSLDWRRYPMISHVVSNPRGVQIQKVPEATWISG